MTALDIIVLLLIGGTAFTGFSRGLTTELLSLGAWAVAMLAVKVLHGPVSAVLADKMGAGGGAMLAFALIFGVAMFAGRLIAKQVGNSAKNSALGMFDRVLGAGFGALKGLIIASIGFLTISLVYNAAFGRSAERPHWMKDSKTYPLLNASAKALADIYEARQDGSKPPKDQGPAS